MPERGDETTAGRGDALPFPPITELLPHRGRAVLLGRVLAHNATTTVCSVDTSTGVLLHDSDGGVPAYFGLEYMAQTVAAHGGLLDREAGREARPGFFLGTRRLVLSAARFEPGQRLEVTAKHLRGSRGLLAFECAIRPAAGAVPMGAVPLGTEPMGAVPLGTEPMATEPVATAPMVSAILTVYLLESFEALARDFAADTAADVATDPTTDA